MIGEHIDLPQGTLDLLILRTLALGSQHGLAISERVQQMSSDTTSSQRADVSKIEEETDAWAKLTAAVAQVLGTV